MAEARIAVIDDDPSQVGVLRELLEDEGYQVIAHGDVLDAVAFIKQERPSLTLLDLVQGHRLIGLDVLRELERDPATRDLPVIVISADAFALRAQADELSILGVAALAKPFQLETLVSMVRETLERVSQNGPAAARG